MDESESRTLQEFEEVSGEFREFKVCEDHERILVTLTLTRLIILPLQLELLEIATSESRSENCRASI